MEIVPLLAEVVASVATSVAKGVAVGHLRTFLKGDVDTVQRAIRTTCSLLEVEGAETALQQWTSCDAFVGFFERFHAGERGFDDENVASFIEEGEFYLPSEEECQTLGTEIITTFLRALSGALYRSAEGVPALANRLEGVHLETGRHI